MAATVYSMLMLNYHGTFFGKYFEAHTDRLRVAENHAFVDFWRLLVKDLAGEKGVSDGRKAVCEGFYQEYRGENPCAYNLAMSMVEAYDFLKTNLS